MPERLILASGSAIRQQMLRDAGVDFTAISPRIDEESIRRSMRATSAGPRDIADRLAEMKARRISAKNPGAAVLGSDQILTFQGETMAKPASLVEARRQLTALRGASHDLYSAAVLVLDGQPVWRHVGRVRLWMRDFSDGYLDAYLARIGDDALATVGAYKLEREGVRLFSKIEGDYFCVLGMPLIEILNYLADAGMIEK